jgi:hypothetical protein
MTSHLRVVDIVGLALNMKGPDRLRVTDPAPARVPMECWLILH